MRTEQPIHGASHRDVKRLCPTCQGSGEDILSDNANYLPCPACHGSKYIDHDPNDKDWRIPYRNMIGFCRSHPKRLTEWERQFLNSIEKQLNDNKRLLTRKQIQRLEIIHESVKTNFGE